MVKRFYPRKDNLRELLNFKNLPKDVQNVMADKIGTFVNFIKFTHDDNCTKITLCEQRVMKYRGGQAFIQTKMIGTICYFNEDKRVYTVDPRRVVEYLQNNHYIAKALQIDNFITDCKLNTWGGRVAGRTINTLHANLETRALGHKNILKAIFRGNCTNRDNAVRRYSKAIYGLNISLKVWLEMKKMTNDHSLELVFTTTTNLPNARNFVVNKAKALNSKQRTILNDLMQMSVTMRRKINFAWTPRRMEEEHDKLVKEMVRLQAEGTPLVEVEYEVDPPNIKGITFLKDNRELLMESKIMHHCVGTSSIYIDRLKKFETFILAYDRSEHRGTAEIRIQHGNYNDLLLTIKQFRGRGNDLMSEEARADLESILKTIKKSTFGEYLSNIHLTQKPKQDDWLIDEPAIMPFPNRHPEEQMQELEQEDVLIPQLQDRDFGWNPF